MVLILRPDDEVLILNSSPLVRSRLQDCQVSYKMATWWCLSVDAAEVTVAECGCGVADEDFVISDDDVDFRELSSEGSEGPSRRRRGSVDSDFVADEDESGSDWESSSRKPVKPKAVCSD